jgi:hypothetical protein
MINIATHANIYRNQSGEESVIKLIEKCEIVPIIEGRHEVKLE